MSLTGNGSKSIRRKDVQEQKSIAVGLKKLVMAHKAALGDTGINLTSLNNPTEMSSLGFVNPNSAEILSANLKFYRNNLRIVSSHKGLLMDYLSYDVVSSSRINFTGFTAEDGEIFVITYDDNAKTGITMVDTAPVVSTGTLAVGVTDYNVGTPFSVGDHATVSQLGSVIVFRNGQVQFRNPNNGTSGGNYQEIAAGGGLGVIIRFNNAPSGIEDNIMVFSLGTAWRPDGSVLAEVENLAGQLDRVIPTVAALAGVPETDFQGAPNSVDMKAFGDQVLDHEQRIDVLELPKKMVTHLGTPTSANPTTTPTTLTWSGSPYPVTLPGWNNTTGQLTAQESGWYRFSVRLLVDQASSTAHIGIFPRVNGSNLDNIYNGVAASMTRTYAAASYPIYINAGQILDFQYAMTSGTSTWVPSTAHFSLEFVGA